MSDAAGVTTTTEASLSWAQALGWRLDRQFLGPVGSGSVVEVVRRLGAVLAMNRQSAELAIRTRRTTSEPDELTTAFEAGEVIVSFAFRGSTHYLAADDGGTYLALRAAGRQWELKSWVAHYRLTPQGWPDFRAAVREALTDGPLTVVELGQALARDRAYRHLEPVFDDGAGTLIKPLSWQGDLSIAPSREGTLTLQRLDTNPRWGGIPALDDAGPCAVLAYFAAYGPATIEHLHYWLGEGLSAGRKRIEGWFAGLSDQLVAVDVDGTPAYVAREHVDSLLAATTSDEVRLLPGHDQWVMGPGTKDTHVIPAAVREVVTRKANLVVHGGVVCGTWTRKADDLAITWLDPRQAPVAAIEAEAQRLGQIVARDLRVSVTKNDC
jgi:hypothetical protein